MRQEIAALEIGYRIGRLLVIREVLRQAPAGFSAATKCFCTEHEMRVAEFVARTLGAEATLWDPVTQGLALRARLHDHGRHLERDAQHPRRARPRPPALMARRVAVAAVIAGGARAPPAARRSRDRSGVASVASSSVATTVSPDDDPRRRDDDHLHDRDRRDPNRG